MDILRQISTYVEALAMLGCFPVDKQEILLSITAEVLSVTARLGFVVS